MCIACARVSVSHKYHKKKKKKIAWCRFINITDEKLVHFQGLTGTEWALHFLTIEFHLSRTYEGEALMNKWVSMIWYCIQQQFPRQFFFICKY